MIQHITRWANLSVEGTPVLSAPLGAIVSEGERPLGVAFQLADRHEVSNLIPSAWPGIGRCDSCGRIIVRGIGRWWERRVWS